MELEMEFIRKMPSPQELKVEHPHREGQPFFADHRSLFCGQ